MCQMQFPFISEPVIAFKVVTTWKLFGCLTKITDTVFRQFIVSATVFVFIRRDSFICRNRLTNIFYLL